VVPDVPHFIRIEVERDWGK